MGYDHTFHSEAVANGNGTAMNVAGIMAVGIQVQGVGVATITFEGTLDGTNWVALRATNVTTGASATTATADGIVVVPVAGLSQLRCRISGYGSGTITVVGHSVMLDASLPAVAASGGATEATLGAVKTAVEKLDDAVSGSEYQVDLVTLPAGNLGQKASAASLSVTPATDVADATYIGDVKFGESPEIARDWATDTLTIADEAAISDALDMRGYAGADVLIPAGWVAANLGFARATTLGGTYTRMRNTDGTLLQITGIVANQVYPFPAEVFPVGFVKLLSQDAAGDDVNQTGGPLSLEVEKKG